MMTEWPRDLCHGRHDARRFASTPSEQEIPDITLTTPVSERNREALLLLIRAIKRVTFAPRSIEVDDWLTKAKELLK